MITALDVGFSEDRDVQVENNVGKVTPRPGVRFRKIPIKIDIETLDLLVAYAYTENSQLITRAALINLKNLVDMCNMNLYKNNQSLKTRIDLIKLLLEAKLEKGLDNKKLLMNYALENIDNKETVREEILPEIKKLTLNGRAISYLNSYICDRLLYGFMYSYQQEIFQIYSDMESGNFTTLRDLTQKFKLILNDLIFDIRGSENYMDENLSLDLSEGNFENIVMQMVNKLKAPGNKLKTGSQAMNILLGGGFESGRSCLFFGLPGIGKSVVLLNICEWIRKFNIVKPKDPEKRPAVLYITQENSLAETIERLFNMTVTGDDIRDYTPSEVANMLRTKGGLSLKGKDDIDLVIKYYDDKEISTTDLYSIIEDIEDTGREVIALVHDYIERIRSSINHPEIRLELAAVANDYSVLAKRLDIPVIGAGQLNRKGSDTIDSAVDANRADLIRTLGKGAVSESWGMLKNLDSAFLIHKEMDAEENEYITFLNIKFRSGTGRNKNEKFKTYAAHPLDPNNGIKLMDDLHLDKPLSKITLDDGKADLEVLKRNSSLRERKELNNKAKVVEEIDDNAILDFKFLGEALKSRKANNKKTDRIGDKKAVKQFDEVFSKYNDKYSRTNDGYIKLKSVKKKERPRVKIVAKVQ